MQAAKEKGSILLATLFLLAVIAVVAIGMSSREYIDIKRTQSLLADQQAQSYNAYAEIWGFNKIKSLPLILDKNTPLTPWPQGMTPLVLPQGVVNATLYDAQGDYFNLNNLSDYKHQQGFISLLKMLDTSSSTENISFLINAIVSWISLPGRQSDILSDQYYLGLIPPYRASHHLFVSPSELRLVKGMTTQMYHALFPLLIALPESDITPINVNTAQPKILMSTGDGLSLNDAQAIIDARTKMGGFHTMGNFFSLPFLKNRNMSSQNYSLDSNYFLLKTMVSFNAEDITVYTLFKREKDYVNKTNTVKILWQLRGSL